MRKNILVAYATNSGSTAEVAEMIGNELRRSQLQVDVCRIKDVINIHIYDMVIVGGPMISGWHAEARQFLIDHQEALRLIPVACFFTALKMTQCSQPLLNNVAIFQDPRLVREPAHLCKPSQKEMIYSVERYLGTILRMAPLVKPVSAGFFAGKLDLSKLTFIQRKMVQIFIGVQPGDYRNWSVIRDWAFGLRSFLRTEPFAIAISEDTGMLVGTTVNGV